MRRTRHSIVAVLVALLLIPGCVGFITGDEPLTYSASPATVGDEALTDAGYEEQSIRTIQTDESVSALGQERRINVTNHIAMYHKTGGNSSVATTAIVATPTAEVAGQGLNPLGRAPIADLITEVVTRADVGFGDVQRVSQTGTETVTILDREADLLTFEATAVEGSTEIETTIHVARVTHDGDYVIAFSAYPSALGDGENVRTMLTSIEH